MHGSIPDWFMLLASAIGWLIDHPVVLLLVALALALAFTSWRCAHHYEFSYNLYGDQINQWGGKRSVWRCVHCGKFQARDALNLERHNELYPGRSESK